MGNIPGLRQYSAPALSKLSIDTKQIVSGTSDVLVIYWSLSVPVRSFVNELGGGFLYSSR